MAAVAVVVAVSGRTIQVAISERAARLVPRHDERLQRRPAAAATWTTIFRSDDNPGVPALKLAPSPRQLEDALNARDAGAGPVGFGLNHFPQPHRPLFAGGAADFLERPCMASTA